VRGGPIFDDAFDCTGGPCDGACIALDRTACTCGVDDPCRWTADGFCDAVACEALAPGAHFADAADCAEPPGPLTFGITSVINELDPNDMFVLADGLVGLGYDGVVRDGDVTTAELTSYLATELTTLYHTGHGSDGIVRTVDGTLGHTGTTIAVHNTIWATCLTLTESWADAFGPTAETVLGYTQVSYDIIDDDVARAFVAELGGGASYPAAWYLANAGIHSLANRWAAYVREGATIVEYSARSHVYPAGAPASPLHAVPLGADGRLTATTELLRDRSGFDLALPAFVVASGEEPERGVTAAGWTALGPTRMPRGDAQERVEAFLRDELGGLPEGAVLDVLAEVVVRRGDSAAATAGYVVRWSRALAGAPVRGNRVADHVAVLVGPGGVVAWSRWWPAIGRAPASLSSEETWLAAGEALRRAAGEVAASLKGELRLEAVRAVYGTVGPAGGLLVPAWEFTDADGAAVVVDVRTGRLVR
jgi:hypothetical protein